MSRVYRSLNPGHVLTARAEVEQHLLAKIAQNDHGNIGTELELFVASPEGRPPTFAQIELLLETMLEMAGPGAVAGQEKGRTVALRLPGLGDVSLEPGGQVELSTQPCKTLEELSKANRGMRDMLEKAAGICGLAVHGGGHDPAFLRAEDMPRSRFHAYYGYCRAQYGEAAEDLIATMKSCCGLQVNLDASGEAFHEIYRALLLLDVAESLANPTLRQKRLHETYARLAPEQLTPVFEALSARDNETLVGMIADRLLVLKVPFLPDPDSAEGFRAAADVYGGRTPTVGQLMAAGLLTTEILDNALSLQLTMPNLRRHGVLETRASDAVDSLDELDRIAARYHRIAYDPVARLQLLAAAEGIDPDRLAVCFLTRFEQPSVKALADFDLGDGVTAGALITATLLPVGSAAKATADYKPQA